MISIKLCNVSKSYGGLEVFSNLSFSMEAGRVYCLMGPSGCGKTTLLRLVLGLEAPDSGTILAEPSPMPVPGKRIPCSAVFQENRLCEAFSPLENLRLTSDRAYSRAQLFRELCRLLPEESVVRPVRTLSGGMKRRVAIARSLLAPSRALLMDEPFTGLDAATKQTVIRYILEKQEGRLLLVATHQQEDALLLHAERIQI